MSRANILLCTTLLVLISLTSAVYDELYRPQIHLSPPSGWMSDPNGLVYHDGVYHVFYQHNPNDTKPNDFPQMYWGHAISTDLVHWKNLDIALSPPTDKSFFSGSGIIDQHNVTGFQIDDDKKPIILLFTSNNMSTAEQEQWIAYSNDAPEYKTFEYYKNNPVIKKLNLEGEKSINFRDPQIIEWETGQYVTLITQDNKSMIYNSRDMINWELVSQFGEYEGKHGGTWECPSLFTLNVTINGTMVEKQALLITLTDAVIPAIQYFIGSFDGKTFKNENPPETILWYDYGPDSFAGSTFNHVPSNRRIFLSWMSRWEYAKRVGPGPWSGNMGLPRELNLKQVGNDIRFASLPVSELKVLRMSQFREKNVTISSKYVSKMVEDDGEDKHTVDIEMILDLSNLKKGDKFDIVFFDKQDRLNVTLKGNEFTLDRSRAGKTDFNKFGIPWKAPRFIDSPELKLRIIIDRSSIEFFADDGLTVMTALFFSKEDIASKMAIHVHSSSLKSTVHLRELNAYKMKSIWN
uniref:MDL1 n=1 Tax=Mayetiola destructor TaxID=39758 RepID=A0A7S5SLE3_MAYDE|nr:MDL1 [Mayetiola destructor]